MPKKKIKFEVGETFDKLDSRKSKRRSKTWRENNRKVSRAYMSLYQEMKAEPTLDEIAAVTGLSRTTVHHHFASMELGNLLDDAKKEFAAFLPDILMAIMQSAMKGNSRSQELYLRLVMNWSPDLPETGDAKLENGLAEALLAIEPESEDIIDADAVED